MIRALYRFSAGDALTTRRELLQSVLGLTACSLASGVGSFANAEVAPKKSLLRPPLPAISLNDQQGADVLNLSLGDPAFWNGAEVELHQGRLYDEIRLKRLGEAGFLAYISGEGAQDFPAAAVAETVYQNQNLITDFMPALKTARYLGEGIDPVTKLEYTDIYFLVDVALFFISVPLRTTRIRIDDRSWMCPIELVTEQMTTPEQWKNYEFIMSIEQDMNVRRWAFSAVVPFERLFGTYIMQPGNDFETRVSMITNMRFAANRSFFADLGSELPFVMKKGMRAGFDGSVHACRRLLERQKSR